MLEFMKSIIDTFGSAIIVPIIIFIIAKIFTKKKVNKKPIIIGKNLFFISNHASLHSINLNTTKAL